MMNIVVSSLCRLEPTQGCYSQDVAIAIGEHVTTVTFEQGKHVLKYFEIL